MGALPAGPSRQLTVDARHCQPADLTAAADWLRAGGIVAFPTDTFYGLAVDPTSTEAVAALFALKDRSRRAALPLIAASAAQVGAACGTLDPQSARLAAAFWPGPLSLILDAPAAIAGAVHGGHGTVAVRVPAHAVARALAEAFGGLVTATSGNRSGEPPADRVAALTRSGRRRARVRGRWRHHGRRRAVDHRGRAAGPVVCVRHGAIAWDRVLHSLYR